MNGRAHSPKSSSASRREFLRQSAAAGTALAGSLAIGRSAHAAGDDALRVGLIGCGGRGTGAAANALRADKNVKLVALADAFSDQLERSHANLKKEFGTQPEKIAVADDHKFVGFDAYQKLIDSGVDVVLLASPPHFRPAHLKAAVAAGKHIFTEKPVAVDAPGVRSVLATGEEAAKKNLSIVSGLCWRYDQPKIELFKRVHDGAIGKILAIHTTYYTGPLTYRPRQSHWSDMEYQLRNWNYFNWLSGDFNVEQHVHSLDKGAWAMHDEPPVEVSGIGGRQMRSDDGNVFDHFAVTYRYADGTKMFSYCRQIAGCANDVTDYLMGTEGAADVMKGGISGKNPWKYTGKPDNMYQVEHDVLFHAIRSGKPVNNTVYMARSTMLAIMGRMAAYTGQMLTWDQCLHSKQDWTPKKYDFGPMPVAPVAKPGVTQFV